MLNMLAFTVQSSSFAGVPPYIVVGQGSTKTEIKPAAPANNSYWFVFLDARNPANKVAEFVVPGTNNTAIPPGVDQYMTNPAYLFAVVTQFIATQDLPQGDFYNYLVKQGAGRELQRLEQILTTVGCGMFGQLSYVLAGQCGTPDSGSPAYEISGTSQQPAALLMSLMPMLNNQPPYSLCNSYTFGTQPQAAHA